MRNCRQDAVSGIIIFLPDFDRETNLKGLWCADDNQWYIGEWKIDMEIGGVTVVPQTTDFLPESQSTFYNTSDVIIEKKCFLPFFLEQEADHHIDEMHTVGYFLQLKNLSKEEKIIVVRNTIVFPGMPCDLFTKQPPDDQTKKRVQVHQQEGYCEITTLGNTNEVRIIGSSRPWTVCSADDRSLIMEQVITLKGNAVQELSYTSAISDKSSKQALLNFQKGAKGRLLLDGSIKSYQKVLSRSFLLTPEPVINRGLQWAKINTVRVQHRYRIGGGFTNDPPQDIIVVRDLAWYLFGSDYLSPQFSHDLLSLGERFGYHDGGKLTEYVHANESAPVQHDYKLNINDDTPLFVYGLYHHALTCNDGLSLEKVFPLMQRACEWIIAQIKNGLVYCNADGTNVWGICGWRNIIDKYTFNRCGYRNQCGMLLRSEMYCRCCQPSRETARCRSLSHDCGKTET